LSGIRSCPTFWFDLSLHSDQGSPKWCRLAADPPEEEDHNTVFRKDWVSKMWFESSEFSCNDTFELSSVDVSESGDEFLRISDLNTRGTHILILNTDLIKPCVFLLGC
jgi:hypothetical protein